MQLNKSISALILILTISYSQHSAARFLQTDPIGYKDQMNLYSYVGNDPVNNRDPSGLKCSGVGDSASCTIDSAKIDGKWVKLDQKTRDGLAKSDPNLSKAIGKLEGNITAGYKSAMTTGDNAVTVKGNPALGIGDKSASGNQIANRMRNSDHNVDNRTRYYNDDPKQREMMVHAQSSSELQFFKGGLDASNYLQQQGALHDTLHQLPTMGQWDNYPGEHQKPFNDAVDPLIQ